MRTARFIVGLLFLVTMMCAASFAAPDVATTPERTGGNIYFESTPDGATVWLDNTKIGTTPFTYFTEKTGTMEVRFQKRLFEDYTGTVTVGDGKRVVFYGRLTPVTGDVSRAETPVVVVTTATIVEKKTAITIPTPWPTTTPASPVDPLVIAGATAVAALLFAIRRT